MSLSSCQQTTTDFRLKYDFFFLIILKEEKNKKLSPFLCAFYILLVFVWIKQERTRFGTGRPAEEALHHRQVFSGLHDECRWFAKGQGRFLLRAKKKTTITHIHKIKTETKWQQLLNYRYKKKNNENLPATPASLSLSFHFIFFTPFFILHYITLSFIL